MDDLEEQIRQMRATTAHTCYQFLLTELQTCSVALDLAEIELAEGKTGTAGKEVSAIDKAIEVIHRFLPGISGEQKAEVETKLAKLKERFTPLKAEVKALL